MSIDWEVGDEYDNAGDGYVTFHHLEGIDAAGNEYKASGALIQGELDESTIEDIVKITDEDDQ